MIGGFLFEHYFSETRLAADCGVTYPHSHNCLLSCLAANPSDGGGCHEK